MIADLIAEFGNSVDEANNELDQAQTDINNAVAENGDAAFDEFCEFIDGLIETIVEANTQRYETFEAWSGQELNALTDIIDERMDNVSNWFAERIEWTEKISDEVYREFLREELEVTRDGAIQELATRRDEATNYVNNKGQELLANLVATLNELADVIDEEKFVTFNNFDFGLRNDVSGQVGDMLNDFAGNANTEYNTLIANLADLTRLWAWWLLKWYNYEGFPMSMYEGYEPDYDDPWVEVDLEEFGDEHAGGFIDVDHNHHFQFNVPDDHDSESHNHDDEHGLGHTH